MIWFELIYVLTVLCLCIYFFFFFFAVVCTPYFIKKENVNQCGIHELKLKWTGCPELKIWDVYCLTVIKNNFCNRYQIQSLFSLYSILLFTYTSDPVGAVVSEFGVFGEVSR